MNSKLDELKQILINIDKKTREAGVTIDAKRGKELLELMKIEKRDSTIFNEEQRQFQALIDSIDNLFSYIRIFDDLFADDDQDVK